MNVSKVRGNAFWTGFACSLRRGTALTGRSAQNLSNPDLRGGMLEDVPPPLAAVIVQATRANRDDRLSDVAAFLDALAAAAEVHA